MGIKIFMLLVTLVSHQITKQSTIIEKGFLIKNDKIELPGTLSYTNENEKLIIWIHGSGNVDRNGNQAGYNVNANYIKQFRDEVNKKNIAFFSYDKRTSNPKNAAYLKGIIFDDFVNDAKAVIQYFKKKNKFKEIILVGHSQGSLVAMLASEGVDKYISLAGPSESIDETIIRQVTGQSADLGKVTEAHFKELKESGDIKDVNPNLVSVFAKPNFPFYRNWMSYNPAEEIKNLKIPILIINGTKDIQVSVDDAKALHEANKNSEKKIINDMNHVLKDIQKDEDNLSSYYSPDYKISKELIKTIVEFVN
tara:strand:+ start:1416 stop:2339 length:924 start_codon:yes stop_codon:yes gene_type:complete